MTSFLQITTYSYIGTYIQKQLKIIYIYIYLNNLVSGGLIENNNYNIKKLNINIFKIFYMKSVSYYPYNEFEEKYENYQWMNTKL